jgi:hypothetical protein
MTVTTVDMVKRWLGWCPNEPATHTVPAVLVVPPEIVNRCFHGFFFSEEVDQNLEDKKSSREFFELQEDSF